MVKLKNYYVRDEQTGKRYAFPICEVPDVIRTTAVGDGTRTMTFAEKIPFEPQSITVTAFHPASYRKANAIEVLSMDLGGLAYIASTAVMFNGKGGTTVQPGRGDSAKTWLARDDDGAVMGLKNATGESTSFFFAAGVLYEVVAHRHTEKSDQQQLEDLLESLDDSGGEIWLWKTKIEALYPGAAAGTNADWTALIADKVAAGWKISMG